MPFCHSKSKGIVRKAWGEPIRYQASYANPVHFTTFKSSLRQDIGVSTHLSRCASPGKGPVPQKSKVCERSEERRVGKECRTGWSPYQEKKKIDEINRH